MRTSKKAVVGILAAVAMLAVPVLSNAADIQGSHPEDMAQSQTETQEPATASTPQPAIPQAAPQLPSAQGACDPAPVNFGYHVSGTLSDAGNGSCKLTITASSSNNTLTPNTLHNFLLANRTITQVAFAGSTKIVFPRDVTELFASLNNLTNIDFGNSVDARSVRVMWSMFQGCSGLTSLDLSNIDLNHPTMMRYMFRDCTGLTSLDLSNVDTSHVSIMTGMFQGCSGLTSLNLGGKFSTDGAIFMQSMFQGCSGLTSLDLSNFNTSSVHNISSMFQGCSGLTSLDVHTFDTDEVWEMNSMFQDCTGLTSLDVSNFQRGHARDISSIFQNCSNLTSLDIGGTFGTSDGPYNMIGKNLLLGDNKLQQITIGRYRPISLRTLPETPWVQLAVPGTDSASASQPKSYFKDYKHYLSSQFAHEADKTTVGTYVRASRHTLTLKPSTALPDRTAVTGDTVTQTAIKTVAGKNVPVRDFKGNTLSAPIGEIAALTGTTTIPETNPFTISGCPEQGCTFEGWSRNADGTGPFIDSGASVDLGDEDVTLYATWKANQPDPAPSDPEPSGPANPSDPAPSDPEPSGPANPSDPAPSDPEPSGPANPSDPAPSDPEPSGSANPSDPAPSDPEPSGPANPSDPKPSPSEPSKPETTSQPGISSSPSTPFTPSNKPQKAKKPATMNPAPTVTDKNTATTVTAKIPDSAVSLVAGAARVIPTATSPVVTAAASPVMAPAIPIVATVAAQPTAAANNVTHPATGASPNATVSQSGRDNNVTEKPQRPASSQQTNPQCMPVAWYGVGVRPAAYNRCPGETIATTATRSTTQQTPIWMFLLLALMTLLILLGMNRRNQFDVIRHRAMKAEQ